MEIQYRVLNLYKNKQYDECIKLCQNSNISKSKSIEYIQMRAMTIQAKIAGSGYEEVNCYCDNNELMNTSVAKTPRPGTTFQRNRKFSRNEGMPASATLRSRAGSAVSARSALVSAARASRAATATASSSYGDALVTIRFLKEDDKQFISAAKTLFEYIFYCENNVRKAMEIIFQVKKVDDKNDCWWWNFSLARCYFLLGMHRKAEECLRQALKQNKHVAIYLRLVAMYVSINQPVTALDVCKQALSVFHENSSLMLEQARIHEMMGNMAVAVKYYRLVALENPSNIEAVANIAMYNFYNDQPEIALRYYRRLLATVSPSPEIYNNLGLCCFYCSQWDLIIPCFRQALYFSTSIGSRSSIWFNLAHVALSAGDLLLARRCLQNSLAISEHAAARKALLAVDYRMKTRYIE